MQRLVGWGVLRQVREVMRSRNNKERKNYRAGDADAGMFTHAHTHARTVRQPTHHPTRGTWEFPSMLLWIQSVEAVSHLQPPMSHPLMAESGGFSFFGGGQKIKTRPRKLKRKVGFNSLSTHTHREDKRKKKTWVLDPLSAAPGWKSQLLAAVPHPPRA